ICWNFCTVSEIHEAVPYAAAGNNSQYEKLIHGSYDTEYKYFSVRAVKLFGKFRLRQDGLILKSDFLKSLRHLPTGYVKKEYIAILQNYGTHYYTKGSVGGKYEFIYVYKESDLKASGLSDFEQRKCLENEARFELLGADVSIVNARCSNMGKSRTLFTNAAKRSFSFVSGGDPAITASLTINSGKEQFAKWTKSISTNPAILNYKISPISELVGSSVSHGNEKKANLERALLQYLEKYNPSSCTELVCHNGAMQVVNQAKHCLCVCTKGWHGSKCDQSK
uniref:MACPF domain-containing protein n=1 Tax=Ciona savignyi TaxID=51511 RepID=H2ZLH8_CIOSA